MQWLLIVRTKVWRFLQNYPRPKFRDILAFFRLCKKTKNIFCSFLLVMDYFCLVIKNSIFKHTNTNKEIWRCLFMYISFVFHRMISAGICHLLVHFNDKIWCQPFVLTIPFSSLIILLSSQRRKFGWQKFLLN